MGYPSYPEHPTRRAQGAGLPTACQYAQSRPCEALVEFSSTFQSAHGLTFAVATCRGHADRMADDVRAAGGTLVSVEDVAAIERAVG